MSKDEPESERRPQKPATIPPPNQTAAAVRSEFISFKRDLFAFLDEKETKREEALGIRLDARDSNVTQHFREMRDELRRLSEEISSTVPKLREDVQRLDKEVDGHDAWQEEFRERTHGIRNALVAMGEAIGELMVRIDKIDGLGDDGEPLMATIARMLTFRKSDTIIAPPPPRSEIPPPPLASDD